MASRKEQKEQLRREREERERQAQHAAHRKRMVGAGIGVALAVAAVAVAVVVLVGGGGGGGGEADAQVLPDGGSVPAVKVRDLKGAADAAGCRLEEERAEDRDHTQDPSEPVRYSTNPPTSGRHYIEAAPDQAYDEAPADVNLVHTLEHGRVIVWFKPSLPEEARANLKAFFDRDQYHMVLVPRRNMPFAVAASAWGRDPEPLGTGYLLGCPRFGDGVFDALRAFREEHRGDGPEQVP